MTDDVQIHNMAVIIFDALNKKGAGLGNASIGIIEKAIEAAQQGVEPTAKGWDEKACQEAVNHAHPRR